MPRRRGLMNGVPDAYSQVGQDIGDLAGVYIGARAAGAQRDLAASQEERAGRAETRAAEGQRFSQGLATSADERAGRSEERAGQAQEFSQGLATKQDERAGKTFDMSAQMHGPALRTATAGAAAAETAADTARLQYNEAARLADRRVEQERRVTAFLANPAKDWEGIAMASLNIASVGDAAGFKAAMNDYKQAMEPSIIGGETRKMLEGTNDLFVAAGRTKSIPDILKLQAEMAKPEYTRAGGHSRYGQVQKLLDKALETQLPEHASNAIREWNGLRASQPQLQPKEAWNFVLSKNPDTMAFFAQQKEQVPYEVREEQEVKGAAAKAGAIAESTLPTDLTKLQAQGSQQRQTGAAAGIEARTTQAERIALEAPATRETQRQHTAQAGDEARKTVRVTASETRETEKLKAEHRTKVEKARTHTELISLLTNSRKELDALVRMNTLAMDDDDKAKHGDEVAAARGRVREYEQQLQGVAGGRAAPAGATGTTAAPSVELPPRGIRADVVQRSRGELAQMKGLTYGGLVAGLEKSVANGKLSQEEADRILETEGKRLKPKGK